MSAHSHIFLSYCHEEVDFALKLASDLKNVGVRIWMDRLDGISVGMRWRDAIQQGLNDAAAMVCVLSPAYIVSEYCRKELGRADTLKRPIYPVLLRPVEAGQLPIELEGIQYEDFTALRSDADYAGRLANLLSQLRAETPDLLSPVPDAEHRYLNTLLVMLESRRGVLQYVALEGDASAPELRPEPVAEDEWGFSELIVRPQQNPMQSAVTMQTIGDAVAQFDRFVLLGDPGAGKSTTLRKLARDAALARLSDTGKAPLPLLIHLAEWKNGITALDFVRSRYPLPTNPLPLLRGGQIRLYLDGLNEMGADAPDKVKLLCKWFQSQDAPRKVILTCRAADYRLLGGDALNLPTIVVKPLDNARIRRFAQSYLGTKTESFLLQALQGATLDDEARMLRYREKQFHEPRRLSELVRNPYMLCALIYLYEKSPSHALPDKTAELFQLLVRAMWKREEQRGTTYDLSFSEAEIRYAQLAHNVLAENSPLEIPAQQARDTLGSPELLYAGLATNYFIGNGERLSFAHQLLLEYFAAVSLRDVDLSTVVEPFDLLFGPNYLWLKYNYESRWYQPVLFACELSSDLDRRLREITLRNPFLAAECVHKPDAISSDLAQTIAGRIFDESHRLLVRLTDEKARVAANRTQSGKWDDIADSIEDSLGELSEYSTATIARFGNQVVPVLREKLDVDKGLALQSLKRIGTAEAKSIAQET